MLIAQSVYSGKNNVVHELQVNGWQPHVEGTYTLYLNPSKHFGGSACWENRGSAPPFSALTKLPSAFR